MVSALALQQCLYTVTSKHRTKHRNRRLYIATATAAAFGRSSCQLYWVRRICEPFGLLSTGADVRALWSLSSPSSEVVVVAVGVSLIICCAVLCCAAAVVDFVGIKEICFFFLVSPFSQQLFHYFLCVFINYFGNKFSW